MTDTSPEGVDQMQGSSGGPGAPAGISRQIPAMGLPSGPTCPATYNCNIISIENTIAYTSQAEHSTLKGLEESNCLCKKKQKHVQAEHPKGEYNCNIKPINIITVYISQAEHSTLKGFEESNGLCKHKQKHIPAEHLKVEYNYNSKPIRNSIFTQVRLNTLPLKGFEESNHLCKYKQKQVPAEHPKVELTTKLYGRGQWLTTP